MCGGASAVRLVHVPRFVIHHRHDAAECGVVFAAFRGHGSPLRRRPALASCPFGGHEIWWTVDAADPQDALGRLPWFVAERSTVAQVTDVPIP